METGLYKKFIAHRRKGFQWKMYGLDPAPWPIVPIEAIREINATILTYNQLVEAGIMIPAEQLKQELFTTHSGGQYIIKVINPCEVENPHAE